MHRFASYYVRSAHLIQEPKAGQPNWEAEQYTADDHRVFRSLQLLGDRKLQILCTQVLNAVF